VKGLHIKLRFAAAFKNAVKQGVLRKGVTRFILVAYWRNLMKTEAGLPVSHTMEVYT
jgi:hypothetical protein